YALPIKSVDFRYYEHEKAITYCRVSLERLRKAYGWYSERKIRILGFSHHGRELSKSLVPDGIFLNSKGERFAFEFESTRKARGRYESKVHDYRMAIARGLFEYVLYVLYENEVARELVNVAGGRGDIVIEHYSHFLSKLMPAGVKL
ncbi:MAG: hypothetical protein ABIH76_08135, partial [Candidatus Bathyarchaeota archaeon]